MGSDPDVSLRGQPPAETRHCRLRLPLCFIGQKLVLIRLISVPLLCCRCDLKLFSELGGGGTTCEYIKFAYFVQWL